MTTSYDYVCKALVLARRTREVFESSVTACSDPLGKEVFTLLQAEGKSHEELIEKVSGEIQGGSAWNATCALDERDQADMQLKLTEMVGRHAQPGACQTELGAVRAAREAVEASLGFYREWEAEAADQVEKEFISRMQGELRSQVGALANLARYYEDPEGWAYDLELEHAPLDGA